MLETKDNIFNYIKNKNKATMEIKVILGMPTLFPVARGNKIHSYFWAQGKKI